MTHSIRVVKKEIRILGLDFCRGDWVPGVVFRGGQYLDGVIAIRDVGDDGRTIGTQVMKSRYYPELRAIIVHNPEERSEPETLQRITGLPCIQVSARKPKGRAQRLRGPLRGELWVKTGLPRETLKAIISLTWAHGSLPEPARVAHLLGRVQNKLPRNSKN